MRIVHSLWRNPGAPANRGTRAWLLHLETQSPHSFRPSGNVAICCLSGELWITQEGDPVDYVVPRGHCFGSKKPGLLVVGSTNGPGTALIYRKDFELPEAFSGCGIFPDNRSIARCTAVANTLRLRVMRTIALRFTRKLRRILISPAK
jgi:hypothetical protein